MIRLLEKRIEKFIVDNIPDRLKLVFFFGLSFTVGYFIGDFIYENAELAATKICEVY
ncbi:MAG: hypothetical protein HOK72_01250 [Flavobacteriales bacterium]|jgi:hypothetical protein|nr:hypothetical protein [Flavobacteriales bacterium]